MRIAVIGHGRSPEGKKWGCKIDSCTLVVRMWDWIPWQSAEDYGVRYDYGLFVVTNKGLMDFYRYNKQDPRISWLGYMGKPTKLKVPENTQCLHMDAWLTQARSMGAVGDNGNLTLTRGTAAALWSIERASYARTSDIRRVLLVGFDNVKAGIHKPIEESFCPEYWNSYLERANAKGKVDKVYPINTAKTATHDLSVERDLLFNWANKFAVNLCFAEDCW